MYWLKPRLVCAFACWRSQYAPVMMSPVSRIDCAAAVSRPVSTPLLTPHDCHERHIVGASCGKVFAGSMNIDLYTKKLIESIGAMLISARPRYGAPLAR